MISFASVLFLIMITFCSLSSKALAAVLGIELRIRVPENINRRTGENTDHVSD